MTTENEIEMPKIQPLPLTKWGTRREWKLLANWHYTLVDGTAVMVPRDFVFDGASIPRVFSRLLSPTGILFIPSLLHDHGYRRKYLFSSRPFGEFGELGGYAVLYKDETRKFWDQMFLTEANAINGKKRLNRIAYRTIRTGGRSAWEGLQKKK